MSWITPDHPAYHLAEKHGILDPDDRGSVACTTLARMLIEHVTQGEVGRWCTFVCDGEHREVAERIVGLLRTVQTASADRGLIECRDFLNDLRDWEVVELSGAFLATGGYQMATGFGIVREQRGQHLTEHGQLPLSTIESLLLDLLGIHR